MHEQEVTHEAAKEAFNWIEHIPVIGTLPNHVVMAVLVGVLLVVFTFIAGSQLRQLMKSAGGEGGLIPDPKLTYRNFFEIVAESLYNLTVSVLGEHEAPTYYPLVGSLFVFVFTSNIVGLIPGIEPATADFNTTFALGVFVFFYYNYAGFRAHGPGYLKHFLGPVLWMSWLILPLELISHLVRPVSLGLRLKGNILGDHKVLSIFNELVPVLLPVVFYGLGVFVSFIQAFVFCLLTMVYISLSTAHDH
jgi:F-type H+-transporting ATPase subunit a